MTDVDLDTGELVERLTRVVTLSQPIAKLAAALAQAQGAMTSAEFDRVNPHFGNKYVSLASLWSTIRAPLAANGLSIVQLVTADGLLVSVETILLHESGEFVRSTLSLTARDVSAQAVGSLVTYLRRYSLSALVGVVGDDDDDANAADTLKSVRPAKPTKDTKKPAAPAPVETITDEQRKRMFAIAKNAGWTNDEIKRFLLERYRLTSSKDMPRELYDEIVSAFHGAPEDWRPADEDERPF